MTRTRSSPASEDEDAPQDADLRGRKAYPLGLVHEGGHPLGEAANVVVDLRDLAGLHAQHRVAVLANPGQREHAPGLELELVLVILVVMLVLGVVVLGVVVLVLGVRAVLGVVVVGHRAASLAK